MGCFNVCWKICGCFTEIHSWHVIECWVIFVGIMYLWWSIIEIITHKYQGIRYFFLYFMLSLQYVRTEYLILTYYLSSSSKCIPGKNPHYHTVFECIGLYRTPLCLFIKDTIFKSDRSNKRRRSLQVLNNKITQGNTSISIQ